MLQQIGLDEFVKKAIKGAQSRSLSRHTPEQRECTITPDYMKELWLVQKGRCAMTGNNMSRIKGHGNGGVMETNGSIDRIDSSKGYVPGNVQWVCWRANRMKGPIDYDAFVDWCSSVVDHVEYHGRVMERILQVQPA